jgi:hypothetical protein
MTLGRHRRSKFFADAGHGGKRKALAAAKAYRDELVATRPVPPTKPARPLLVVRQGQKYVQIRLPKPRGGTTTTEFSVKRHGVKKAKQLAVEAYETAAGRSGLTHTVRESAPTA